MGMIRHSKPITRGARWHTLRMAVLERDGYECQSCGKRRGRLEIDHIKPVKTHPALAYDPGNLQALCTPCHTIKTNAERGNTTPDPNRAAWRKLLKGTTNA